MDTCLRLFLSGVPARWTLYQRRALEYAAELAGLESVRLVAEPELAIRAYGLRTSPNAQIIAGGFGNCYVTYNH